MSHSPLRTRSPRPSDPVLPALRTRQLSPDLEALVRAFFDKIDADKNGTLTKEEAVAFWGKKFGPLAS